MRFPRLAVYLAAFASFATSAIGQELAAAKLTPNLESNIDRPLRYRPDHGDFVIVNGAEFFNRSLYGGNTAFRVDGGDQPEFVLYLPGRGGNLRLGVTGPGGTRWLHHAAAIETRYRPGELLYEIKDPALGGSGVIRVAAIAYADTEGLGVRIVGEQLPAGTELLWAYGGINGQRGKRDGDIGTERVPISEWFQLQPEFCRGNVVETREAKGERRKEGTEDGFVLRAKVATIIGEVSKAGRIGIADARSWDDPGTIAAEIAERAGEPNLSTADPGAEPRAATAGRGAAEPSGAAPGTRGRQTEFPIVAGRITMASDEPVYLAFVRRGGAAVHAEDIDVYREVTANGGRTLRTPPQQPPESSRQKSAEVGQKSSGDPRAVQSSRRPGSTEDGSPVLPPKENATEAGDAARHRNGDGAGLETSFAAAERHFAELRSRVSVDTPDEFLNAAVGALNVAADAVWDEPQHAIMHGAIAWRTRLLGWRGPYALDALGWHERFRENAEYWLARQNTDPIPDRVPAPEEKFNLARNEAGLHTNGDLSNSHYDMNLVFIDALFRHLQWTGDLKFARQAWPIIERHLAWERRLFRREFGPEKLPLYEAYAAIWASDDLQYNGGGTAHASAYNDYENRQAARLARLLGADPEPYEKEAALIARAMRELLWTGADQEAIGGKEERRNGGSATLGGVPSRTAGVSTFQVSSVSSLPGPGWFAESKDWLGLQRVHPDAALWTFYHTMDSEVPTPEEAWQMADYVRDRIPHLPVRGPGVPSGFCTLGTSDWMPYDWSVNNVVMAEAVHGALGLWQGGRTEEAWSVAKGSLLAAMYLGISPGNVGSMSYLDVYRRESQRDFADGSGVLSRTLVEGLFGVKVDALAGVVQVRPGWPQAWSHASIEHPDFSLAYRRDGDADEYAIGLRSSDLSGRLQLQVVARRDRIASVTVDGSAASWCALANSVGAPRIEVLTPAKPQTRVVIRWTGEPIHATQPAGVTVGFRPAQQGQMRWREPISEPAGVRQSPHDSSVASEGLEWPRLSSPHYEPVDLTAVFNDRVTQIFKHEYRSPRSPFVSLALPKQGIGGWAGGVNRTAAIDDSGLRAVARRGGGRLVLPNGVPLASPGEPDAPNIAFASQWDNFPSQLGVPIVGRARGVVLLLAGTTNPMQSRFENGIVVVTYRDGTETTLGLVNPTNWWPIEQDYFVDSFQFNRPGPLPMRVDLKTGRVRELRFPEFLGAGGSISGGAATVLMLPLDSSRDLKSLTVHATANDVVIGLMAATLVR